MHEGRHQRTTLVLTDVRDQDGTVWRAVGLTEDGRLTISGHDLGPGVERIHGCSEYELERRLSIRETDMLRRLLGVDDGDLLGAIKSRFASTPRLEDFLQAHGIPGRLWNRIGD